ncbi:cytochrome P450 [Lactarius indigo]|nr:cytochrome P450 [Lactarius indigo]
MRAPTFITAVDIIMASLFLYLLFAFRDHKRRRGLPYPPGPKPWPIIGNLLDSPKQLPWITYAEMSKKYSDILYLQVLGQSVVVLCSPSVAKDLLEKRGDIYSDRPAWPMPEIMDIEWLLPFTRYGEHWRERRKIADRNLRPGAVTQYHHKIEENTRTLLSWLLAAPADFRSHVDLSHGRLIMSLVYGYDLKENDEITKAPVELVHTLSRLLLPGAALVNHFPFLRHIPSWVPWLSYEPLARLGRELGQRTMNEPMDFVKKAMRDGTAVSSLARDQLLEVESLNGPEQQMQENLVKQVLGSMYEAPYQSASTTTSLFVALSLYPEVQRRAQAQIDSVVSRDRLPTFNDRSRLPYIEAICKELIRWQIIGPLGVPHSSTEDSVYRGFFIPKGCHVTRLKYLGILHNPELYPDPEIFNPERFLNEDGTFRDDPTISLAFGSGKRICPGRHLVDTTLFMVVVSVLSVFNVTKAKDENGREIPVSSTLEVNDVTCYPAKFECSVTPRDQVAEDLIRENAQA